MDISVVIPTFNRRELLLEALASVEAQTLRPAEVIVVDDGSSDGTREMLESMGGRLRPLFQSNAGAAAARNRGIEAAKGDWIAFLDSDDWWEPSKLAKQVEARRRMPTARVVYVDSRAVDFAKQPLARPPRRLHEGEVTKPLFLHTFVHTPAVLAETRLLRDLGGFDSGLRVAEDYDLWLRASLLTPFALVPEPLFVRRVHEQSLAHAPNPRNGDDKCLVLERFAARPDVSAKLPAEVVPTRLAEAHWQAARGYWAAASPAGARPHLKRVLELDPWHWRARWLAWRVGA